MKNETAGSHVIVDTNDGRASKIPLCLGYAYVLLPFLIFSLGWMRLYFSIPVVVILLGCFWKACKESPALWMPEFHF